MAEDESRSETDREHGSTRRRSDRREEQESEIDGQDSGTLEETTATDETIEPAEGLVNPGMETNQLIDLEPSRTETAVPGETGGAVAVPRDGVVASPSQVVSRSLDSETIVPHRPGLTPRPPSDSASSVESRSLATETPLTGHRSDGVVVCTSCHGKLEGFENGRPHLMSWLMKGQTGQEVPLVLPPSSQLNAQQQQGWIHIQHEIEFSQNYQCTACGHTQCREITKLVYLDSERSFAYTGRDVRAVHVIPPVIAPELMHHPANLILLCLDCLFGSPEQNETIESDIWSGWKDEPALRWAKQFAPRLLRDYEGRILL